MFHTEFKNDCITLKNIKNFDLRETFDCGQAFRWEENENGSWSAVVKGKYITVEKKNSDIIMQGISETEFNSFFKSYFDLDRDYESIINKLSENEILKKAALNGLGIRILNQEPWETLCSFIISQNNNIPRIKGIISRLCSAFGEKCEGGYSFPDARTLADLTEEDLAPLRSGFRAKYIIDAAKKVSSGELELENLKEMSLDSARAELMKIKGVGPKVADCTLLFGLGHIDAFPQDVWIKRAMKELFNSELPECARQYAGIAQQYIFYYMRNQQAPK